MTKREVTPPTEADYALATEVAAWMEGLEERGNLSDYLYNISRFGRAGIVTEKGLGIVASAIVAYQRDLNEENEKKITKATSTHFGSIGDKIVLKLTMVFYMDVSSELYSKHLYKFVDESGNVFVWFASNEVRIEEVEEGHTIRRGMKRGESVWLKGSIKEHSEYEGVKQTVLTRCSLTDSPEETAAKKAAEKAAKSAAKKEQTAARKAFGKPRLVAKYAEVRHDRWDEEEKCMVPTGVENGREVHVMQLSEKEFVVEHGVEGDMKRYKEIFTSQEDAEFIANRGCYAGGTFIKKEG